MVYDSFKVDDRVAYVTRGTGKHIPGTIIKIIPPFSTNTERIVMERDDGADNIVARAIRFKDLIPIKPKNKEGEQTMESNATTVRIMNVKAVDKAGEKIILEKTLFIKMVGADAMYKERAVRKLILENAKAFTGLKEENLHFIVTEEGQYAAEEAN